MRAAVATAVLAAMPLVSATPSECRAMEHRGKRIEAQSCYLALSRSGDPFLRAEGLYGLRNYAGAHAAFKEAMARQPKNPEVRVRWGRMLLEPFNKNKQDAVALFSEALEIDEKHAGAMLGLAMAASDSFESKAVEMAGKALEADPKLVEARELLAQLALEDSNPEKAVKEADAALAISPEALDAMAVRAAVEILADRDGGEWLKKVAAIHSTYGNAHAIIAHHLVLNRRYEEGIEHYRKAIQLDPDHQHARSQMGINLMRIGKDAEARKLLEQAFEAGFRDPSTTNTLNLMDSYKNFQTFETPKTVLRLHKKESEILRIYFEDELRRAIATFEEKYKTKLKGPVRLEVYPDHEDFAVRTMGMPGLGALGVTFGNVVAMDSPSGREPGSFHWASTLWHELSHVFVLSATNHRVPRWFTEGLAVHEETAEHPDWGDRITVEMIMALKEKKLLPVKELDRGFIRPKYPAQVIVSYFQAGQICDYIKGKWGYQKLLDMMHSFGDRKTTGEVIRMHLGMEGEQFDKEFLAWLDGRTKGLVDGLNEWKKNRGALGVAAKAKKWDEVIEIGKKVRAVYPEDVEAGNAYVEMASAYEAKGDKKSALEALTAYGNIGGRDPKVLEKLAGWQSEAGLNQDATKTLTRLNWIYPVAVEGPHQKLGDLYYGLKNFSGAVREYRAVLALKPLDQATAHYNLARAYLAAKNPSKAEEHVFLALESAPGYRPAQKLLLEVTAGKKANQ